MKRRKRSKSNDPAAHLIIIEPNPEHSQTPTHAVGKEENRLTSSQYSPILIERNIQTGLTVSYLSHFSCRSSKLDLASASVLHSLFVFPKFPISGMEYPVILDDDEVNAAAHKSRGSTKRKMILILCTVQSK